MEVGRLCLDTSAYANFRRGSHAAVRAIQSARLVLVPSITLGELRVGFARGTRAEQNAAELREFLDQPVVRILDVDDAAASCYARIVVQLLQAGTPLPTNDIWIAALALREGATVLTFDEHFARIAAVGSIVLSAGS